jgi:hypothetical protein
MALRVKYYSVRFGELEDWCINKYICTKRPKFEKVFKKSQYKEALEFANKHNSKVEWALHF